MVVKVATYNDDYPDETSFLKNNTRACNNVC